MEWWDGLLKYGNLYTVWDDFRDPNREDNVYTWQHLFIAHLECFEKGILLSRDETILIDEEQYIRIELDCFQFYELVFKKRLSQQMPKITLESLKKIYQITTMWLHNLGADTIEPLQELKNLQVLVFSDNKISNLEPLRKLKNLQELDCGRNYNISSLEPLRELENLQELNCSITQISSLQGLQGCKNLQKLYCGANNIESLEPLRELKNLQVLDCHHNKIESLASLRELKNLQRLDCTDNQINSLEIQQFEKENPNCIVSWETFTFD